MCIAELHPLGPMRHPFQGRLKWGDSRVQEQYSSHVAHPGHSDLVCRSGAVRGTLSCHSEIMLVVRRQESGRITRPKFANNNPSLAHPHVYRVCPHSSFSAFVLVPLGC